MSEPPGVLGPAGSFRVEVLSSSEAAGVCLAVRAAPPVDSAGLEASPVQELTLDMSFTGMPDSVEVQLVLTR